MLNKPKLLYLISLLLLYSCKDIRTVEEEDSNGNIIKTVCEYRNGKKNGQSEVYNQTGILLVTAEFENDTLNGEYVEYYVDGGIKKLVNYKKGKRNGIYKSYDEDGNLLAERTYVNGEIHGLSINFFSDGSKALVGKYVNGLKEGKSTSYFSSGKIKKIAFFERGNLIDTAFEFNEKGDTIGIYSYSWVGKDSTILNTYMELDSNGNVASREDLKITIDEKKSDKKHAYLDISVFTELDSVIVTIVNDNEEELIISNFEKPYDRPKLVKIKPIDIGENKLKVYVTTYSKLENGLYQQHDMVHYGKFVWEGDIDD